MTVVNKLDIAPLQGPDIGDFALDLDLSMPAFGEDAALAAPLPATEEEALPPIESLEALTLELPPLPDFSNFTLDDDLSLDLPAPNFAELKAAANARTEAAATLDELETWLAADHP